MTTFAKAFTRPLAAAFLAAGAALSHPVADAAVIFSVSGTSAAMNPVSFQATLSIAGDTLTIGLFNTSPVDSSAAADVLSSFYFDIEKAGVRPTLSYQSAGGFVWQVKNNAADLPYNYTPPTFPGGPGTYTLASGTTPHVSSDLKAVKDNDRTWQFKPMIDSASPFLGFGIGTVGNAGFPGNGFDVPVVGPAGPSQIAFSIYRDGGIQPVGNLADEFLVENSATFVFSGVSGYTEQDIAGSAVFGLGTGPDSTLYVPEPGGLMLAAAAGFLGLVSFARGQLRRSASAKRRSRSNQPDGSSECAFAFAVLASMIVLWVVVLARPAAAAPVTATFEYDFATGPKGWTAQNANYAGIAYSPNTWAWSGGLWQVDPVSVISRFNWVANYLTSPVLTVPAGTDRFDITIRHRYRFPTDITTLDPITAGQFAWRRYDPANPNAPFKPFSGGDQWSTGPVPPPFDSLSPYPSYVAPTYPVPASYPPLITGDEAFRDASPGWSADFVISGISLDGSLVPGEQVQLRFINANLGVECTGGGWDVSLVSINAVAPEPGGILLAAVGGGTAIGGTWLRRRYQRPSRPSEIPVRNTLPPVSVA